MFNTLDEYKGANNELQDKLLKQELTSLVVLGEYKLVELEVKQLKAEKEMLTITTQHLVLTSSCD